MYILQSDKQNKQIGRKNAIEGETGTNQRERMIIKMREEDKERRRWQNKRETETVWMEWNSITVKQWEEQPE